MPKNSSKTTSEPVSDSKFPPLLEYLQSPQGHEIISKVLALVNDLKIATLDKNTEKVKDDSSYNHKQKIAFIWLQGVVFVITIVAAVILSIAGRFDSTIGVLFGTLVGYFFGKDRLIVLTKKTKED